MASKKRLHGTNLIARNLQWLMEQERITQQALADATGVGQPTINRILTGRNLNPRESTLYPLATHFDVTMEDLKFKNLSQSFGLPSSLRGVKIAMVDSRIVGKVPIGQDWPDRITVYRKDLSKDAFDMDVSDEAMEPRLHKGDHVIVEPSLLPRPGNFVAVRVPDLEAAIVRKYKALESTNPKAKRDFELVPLDEDFPRYSSRTTTTMQWLGVCVERRESLVD